MHVGVCENGGDVYRVPRSTHPAALKLIPIRRESGTGSRPQRLKPGLYRGRESARMELVAFPVAYRFRLVSQAASGACRVLISAKPRPWPVLERLPQQFLLQ